MWSRFINHPVAKYTVGAVIVVLVAAVFYSRWMVLQLKLARAEDRREAALYRLQVAKAAHDKALKRAEAAEAHRGAVQRAHEDYVRTEAELDEVQAQNEQLAGDGLAKTVNRVFGKDKAP